MLAERQGRQETRNFTRGQEALSRKEGQRMMSRDSCVVVVRTGSTLRTTERSFNRGRDSILRRCHYQD